MRDHTSLEAWREARTVARGVIELLELAADSQLFPADQSTELREHSRRARNLLLALLKHRRSFSAE